MKRQHQGRRLLFEFGPLLVFFLGNWLGGMYWATALLMVAVLAALAAAWTIERRVAIVPLITAVFVGIFGGLTLWLHSEVFIQVKVTLLHALLGTVLLGGLAFGRSFLRLVMEQAITMPEPAWRTLTLRWGCFFLAMAALNEVLRHTLTWDGWVTFKVFGVIGLIMLFTLANTPFVVRHMVEDDSRPAA
jgi:intracellular septation protein